MSNIYAFIPPKEKLFYLKASKRKKETTQMPCIEDIKLSYKNEKSRDRPKSAPYPRLKNSKKTSKCQVFSFTVLKNRKFFKKNTYLKNGQSGALGPASASPWRAKRGTLPKLSTFLSQLKGGPFGEKTNFRKKITMPNN